MDPLTSPAPAAALRLALALLAGCAAGKGGAGADAAGEDSAADADTDGIDGAADGADGADGAGGGGSAPTLTLGLGRTAFAPLTDEAGLVYGPQGGWHIEPALRVVGLAPAGLQLQWQGIDVATGAVNTYANTLLLSDRNVVPGADGGWDRVGDLLIFDVDSDDQVLEHQVRVRAALADAAGAPLAEVEATVTVVCCG